MFNENDLNEFVNKMIENACKSSNKSNLKTGLSDFKKYLAETKMCSQEYLQKLDKIVKCSDELVSLKMKMGDLDIMTLFNNEEKAAVKQKKISTKSNNRASSNSCTGSSYTSSSCGGDSPAYSSVCGGSSSYSNRC